ncbi:porin [Caballeronia insecticola]|uniref:Outer membrane porin OmpC family n=1 Tax=Caballeronia insecticola TaxID=758793 RepID=A0A060PH38_9BURK|nr:porin [Caballeronia insecticola]BAO94097.1 outer membrane porin OmpC family [Caballeronia insecticola]
MHRIGRMAAATAFAAGILVGEHANATSSVTLYGVLDDSLLYVSNAGGHSNFQMSSGGRGSSKWGMLGSEDLGGGTQAIFRLENGFDTNTGKAGQNGALFGRYATVGLTNDRLGSIQLGRSYELLPLYLNPQAASITFGGGLATHAGDVDNVYGTYQLNNVIRYESPKIFGTTFGAIFSPGGRPGNFAKGRAYEVGFKGDQGGFSYAALYANINNPATTLWYASADPVSGSAFTNPLSNTVYAGYASAGNYQVYGTTLAYTFGNSMIATVLTNTRFGDVIRTASTPFAGTHFFRNAELSYTYQFTPAFNVGVGADYTKGDDAHYWQGNLGASYLLSKRTYVYAVVVAARANGIDSTGKPAGPDLLGQPGSTSPNEFATRIGLRHTF